MTFPFRGFAAWSLGHAVAFTLVGSACALYVLLALGLGGEGVAGPGGGVAVVGSAVGGLLLLFGVRPVALFRWSLKGWGHSWMSRGVTFLALFIFLATVGAVLNAAGDNPVSQPLGIAAALSGLVVLTYQGLLLASTHRPPWDSAFVPVRLVIGNLAGGTAGVVSLSVAYNGAAGVALQLSLVLMLVVATGLALAHSLLASPSPKRDRARTLVRGDLRAAFWGGIGAGFLLPAVLILASFYARGGIASLALGTAPGLVLLGLVIERYCLLKCAVGVNSAEEMAVAHDPAAG